MIPEDRLAHNKKEVKEMRVAVQGFGNAGYHFARLAKEAGFTIVALSDSKGAIYSKEGLDPQKIMFHRKRHKDLKAMLYCDVSICEEAQNEIISNEELLKLDVDILVLAAMENQITEDNASKIKAPLILEIANGPINSEADDILEAKNIRCHSKQRNKRVLSKFININ